MTTTRHRPKKYTLTALAGAVLTLTKQTESDFTIMSNGSPVTSVTVGSTSSTSPESVAITIESTASPYANAVITCEYNPKSIWNNQSSSQCDICFNLKHPDKNYWTIMGHASQGDNRSIFPSSANESTPVVEVQVPTEQNPSTPASQQPVLDPNMVYLLDVAGNSVVFRGNSPLGADTTSNPNQLIDFTKFIAALNEAFEKETNLSLPSGGYEICVIALLSRQSEDGILTPEIQSFGGTTGDLGESWYPSPSSPGYPIPGTSITGRMCQWNVNPAGTKHGTYVQMAASLAQNLCNWIYRGLDGSGNISTPRLFYFHCASGHDRTGMMCASYLNQKTVIFNQSSGVPFNNDDLTENFIAGTTLNKLPTGYTGGQYVRDCYNVGTDDLNQDKSRCFLISGSYNQTVAWVAEKLSGVSGLTISDTALSGDPKIPGEAGNIAYVESVNPPWNTADMQNNSLIDPKGMVGK